VAKDKREWKGFGPDPKDTSSVLYVQPEEMVTPIRQLGDSAELGDPVKASELAKESDS
jgi:hypothetical protein